jgi:hypothetical protein
MRDFPRNPEIFGMDEHRNQVLISEARKSVYGAGGLSPKISAGEEGQEGIRLKEKLE